MSSTASTAKNSRSKRNSPLRMHQHLASRSSSQTRLFLEQRSPNSSYQTNVNSTIHEKLFPRPVIFRKFNSVASEGDTNDFFNCKLSRPRRRPPGACC